jgi:hypothetical protein
LVALLLFAVDALRTPPETDASEIVVSSDQVRALSERFVREYGRSPSDTELEERVWLLIDEEIRFREGVALGLAQGDPIVRRRVLQKMGFVEEAIAEPSDPTVAELEQVLAAAPEQYEHPALVAFEHVFFSLEGDEPELATQAAARALESGADASTLGEAFLQGRTITERTITQVADDFGPGFAGRLEALPVGRWRVVESRYGWHAVRFSVARAASAATVATARPALERDWRAAELETVKRALRDERRTLYAVRVESP